MPFWPHAPGSASPPRSFGHMPQAKRRRRAPCSAGHLPQDEPRKCQRLTKRGSHFVGSAWGKWQDCEVEVEPLQSLACSSVQGTSFGGIGFLSQARQVQSAERKTLNLAVVDSSLTVGVGAFSIM